MRYYFTLLIVSLFYTLSSSQNPIIKEETYQLEDGKWVKASILQREYQNDQVVYEKTSYFNEFLRDWIPQSQFWYDERGNQLLSVFQYYQGPELGYFTNETRSQYDDQNRLLLEEIFYKSDKNQPRLLARRTEGEMVDDCSYILRRFGRIDEMTDELELMSTEFYAYDKDCNYVSTVMGSQPTATLEELSKQVRINVTEEANGETSQTVERLLCPEIFGCDDWQVTNRQVYDAMGDLIVEQIGSTSDYERRIINYDYEGDLVHSVIRTFRLISEDNPQILFNITAHLRDGDGKLLNTKAYEPTFLNETQYNYNEEGLLETEIFISNRRDSIDRYYSQDTTFYAYDYYCDDLLKEETTNRGTYGIRKTFSYLYPTGCETPILRPIDYEVYPSPARNHIMVASPDFTSTTTQIAVTDIYGRTVKQLLNYRNTEQFIDIMDLPNGLYFISIGAKEVVAKPFVVQR